MQDLFLPKLQHLLEKISIKITKTNHELLESLWCYLFPSKFLNTIYQIDKDKMVAKKVKFLIIQNHLILLWHNAERNTLFVLIALVLFG